MEDVVQVNAFLEAMRQFSPTIPEEIVEYYLQQAGFVSNDPRVTRMISLAAHKLLMDVTHDAMQFQRIRSQSASSTPAAPPSGPAGTSANALSAAPDATDANAGSRAVLTMEDLAASLKEYGVNISKPEYVSDVAKEPTA